MLCVPLVVSSRFSNAVAYYAGVAANRWMYFFLAASDEWVVQQFEQAELAAKLDPKWVFLIGFEEGGEILTSAALVVSTTEYEIESLDVAPQDLEGWVEELVELHEENNERL